MTSITAAELRQRHWKSLPPGNQPLAAELLKNQDIQRSAVISQQAIEIFGTGAFELRPARVHAF
jgi:hypothetical protein